MKIEFRFRKRWRDGYCILLGWSREYSTRPCGGGTHFNAFPLPILLVDFFGLTFIFKVKPKIRAVYKEQGIQLAQFEEGSMAELVRTGKILPVTPEFAKMVFDRAARDDAAKPTDEAWQKLKAEHIKEVVPVIKKVYDEKK